MFLHGDFSLISPPSLLQTLGQERRSARITAWRGESVAVIDLLEGMVVAARCDDLRGEEAVFRFASWDYGRFQVGQQVAAPELTEMAAFWEELLLEGARRRDELELTLPPVPDYPQRATLDGLLAECPALAGFALVGYDGRLLAAVGLDEEVATQATALVCNLDAVGQAFGARRGVVLYAGGGGKLLLADLGGMLLLGLPAPGASVGEATSQIAALAQEAFVR
jgi:hypothetical protein